MNRHNVGKRTAKYYCKNKRGKTTNCTFSVSFRVVNGAVDTNHAHYHGKHSRGCCFKSGVNIDTYDYEGKELEMDQRVLDVEMEENDREVEVVESVASKEVSRVVLIFITILSLPPVCTKKN